MKELKDFPGYFVTEDGRVFSAWKRRIIPGKGCESYLDYITLKELKPSLITKGYLALNLKKGNKKISQRIHRLVAETYIENPDNLPQVNHIDEDKINNHVVNLEWTTNYKNSIHSKCRWNWEIQNIITGEIIETINLNEFAKINNLTSSHLRKTLTGERKQHKNFKVISKKQFK